MTYTYRGQGRTLTITIIVTLNIVGMTYAAGSCSLSSGSPDDPETPRKSSSSWTAQCSESELPSGLPPALPGPPHISVSILQGPTVELYRWVKVSIYMNIIIVQHICFSFLITIYLIKVPLLLVKVGSQTISSLYINHEVLHFTMKPLLGLLQRGTLWVHSLNALLSFLQTLGKLFPAVSKYFLVLNCT